MSKFKSCKVSDATKPLDSQTTLHEREKQLLKTIPLLWEYPEGRLLLQNGLKDTVLTHYYHVLRHWGLEMDQCKMNRQLLYEKPHSSWEAEEWNRETQLVVLQQMCLLRIGEILASIVDSSTLIERESD